MSYVNDDRKNESNNQLDEIKHNSPLPSIETNFIENDDKPLEVTKSPSDTVKASELQNLVDINVKL